MNLIYIHAHLEHEKFEDDLDEVIKRAEKAGVKVIINSGVNKKTNREALELTKKYDIIKCSFGIYPIDALAKEMAELIVEQKDTIERLEKRVKFLAHKVEALEFQKEGC